MREFINILEAENDTVTLYRGDSSKIDQFDLSKTDAEALLGVGIYLTDDVTVAKDYTIKSTADPNIVFRSRAEERPTDLKQLTAEFLRSLANKGADHRRDTKGELDNAIFDLKVKWEQKYHRDSANLDWTDKEARGKMQAEINAQFQAEKSALIRKAVEAAKAEFKRMRPDMRAIRLTTGEYVFTKKDRDGVVSTFEVPKDYIAKCLDVERPLPDSLLPVVKAAFARAAPTGDADQPWDLRHWDEKGGQAMGRTFDQFVQGYKTLGSRYAWTDTNIGEKGENPSLDVFWNGTHSGYHVFQNDRIKQEALIADLKKLGYVGYFYDGGVRMAGTQARGGGGLRHNAYVFWNADEINSFRRDNIEVTDDEVGDVEKGMRSNKVWR